MEVSRESLMKVSHDNFRHIGQWILLQQKLRFYKPGLKYRASENIYQKLNPLSEKCCEFIEYSIMNILQWIFVLPKIIVSFAAYFTTELGSDAFELPFPCWFPFDWRSPFGYSVACALQYILIRYVFYFVVFCVCFEIGFFLLLKSITDDIKNSVKILNVNAKRKRRRLKLAEQLGDFVQIHSHAKQLSKLSRSLALQSQISSLYLDTFMNSRKLSNQLLWCCFPGA